MKKYLVIGSAPYIGEWYRKHGRKYLDKGYLLVAINNAWAISPDDVHIWIHSSDFKYRDGLVPQAGYDWIEVGQKKAKRVQINENDKFKPYAYNKGRGSGTMILNTLCYLLNETLKGGEVCIVSLAGCDCVYKEGEKNHFYPGGTPDPLRYGEEWLVGELVRLRGFYEHEGCLLVNAGGHDETLLPFEQVTPCE